MSPCALEKRVIGLLCCAVLGGCSTIRQATIGEDENLLSGAGSVMTRESTRLSTSDTEEFELIDLDKLLKLYGLDSPSTLMSDGTKDGSADYKFRRNDLLHRIISASNQKCGTYIRKIVASKATHQTIWSSLGLLFSGAASVLPHAATAKAFAAGSTASTGVLGTYNEAHFNNLAVNIIASGISKRREVILDRISGKLDKKLTEYPISAAIADAVEYHGSCNIVSGMETASEATKRIATSNLK